jgi:hypothetical protein
VDRPTLTEDLHRLRGDPDLDRLMHQGVRDAVEVVLDGDVVVDVDRGLEPQRPCSRKVLTASSARLLLSDYGMAGAIGYFG